MDGHIINARLLKEETRERPIWMAKLMLLKAMLLKVETRERPIWMAKHDKGKVTKGRNE